MNVYPVEGSDDKSLKDVDAHCVAKELLRVNAISGPDNLMVWEPLKPCGFRCCDSPTSGPEPVALSFGKSKCRCFGSRSWVF